MQTERRGPILVLDLSNLAAHNNLSAEVCAAGVEALNMAETGADVRCVVLRGGATHFCSGAAPIDALRSWLDALRTFPKPVLAAVEGWAAGNGCALALACDLIIAADTARFLPEADMPLPRPLLFEALWSDQGLSADRLHRLGWVNVVCAAGQAFGQALQWATRLTEKPAQRLADSKELVNRATTSTIDRS